MRARERISSSAPPRSCRTRLAQPGLDDGRQVAHPRDGLGLAGAGRPPDRGRRERFEVADRVPDAHAAAVVHVRGPTELGGEGGEDLLQVDGNTDRDVARPPPGLLLHDRDLVLEGLRVVRANLRAEPVLERRHDPAAVGVVVGVRGGDEQQVEREPDPVPADLHVALLQDVEQGDLDPFGQVGELVDRHDAPVGPRDHPVVDRELVGEVAALGHPDRVDVADQVGHARVRGGELLCVSVLPADPPERNGVALLRDERAARGADRAVRVVVHLAPGDRGRPLVQEVDELTDQTCLGLPALAEDDEVVTARIPRSSTGSTESPNRPPVGTAGYRRRGARAGSRVAPPSRSGPGTRTRGARRSWRAGMDISAYRLRREGLTPATRGRGPCTRSRIGVRPGGGRSPQTAPAASRR